MINGVLNGTPDLVHLLLLCAKGNEHFSPGKDFTMFPCFSTPERP
jgi:hypothetical protein